LGINPEAVGLKPARLRLLFHIIVRPRTPTELALIERKHLSNVSRTLGELKKQGLVYASPSGSRETYYAVTREGYLVYLHTVTKIR
jgi:DNA-binding MarR family transcriptional regulator